MVVVIAVGIVLRIALQIALLGVDHLNRTSAGTGFAVFNPSEVAIPASKAYLKINTGGSVRELRVMFDDETAITGISEKIEATEGYYDLSGRRVAKPTRGLYIVNGKKVVIK